MPIFYGSNKLNLPGVSKVMFGNNEYYKPDTPGPTPPTELTPLCFTAEQAGSTVKLTKSGTPGWTGEYSTDGVNWSSYTPSTATASQTITLTNIGDKVYFRGDITNNFGNSNCLWFKMTGKIAASGNCNSMYISEGFNDLTTLTYTYCYFKLFAQCTALTSAPQLPALVLSNNCYSTMFYGCTGLTSYDYVLPATTLAQNCYQDMFSGCTSLAYVPDDMLPATTIPGLAYEHMFDGCSSLVKAPLLPAETVGSSAYSYLFANCSKLNYIKTYYSGFTTSSGTVFNYWVQNVSSSGNFYYTGTTTNPYRGVSNVPSGWTVTRITKPSPLTVKTNINATCKFTQTGNPGYSLKYSSDNTTWNNYTFGTDVQMTADTPIYWKGTLNGNPDSNNYITFSCTNNSNLIVSGNASALCSYDELKPYNFYKLFKDCQALKNINNLILEATTLQPHCYENMFENCTSLVNMSSFRLPATVMVDSCYKGMFKGCTSLDDIYADLVVNTTQVAESCYESMFEDCSTLGASSSWDFFINLPPLGDRRTEGILAVNCYKAMFKNCTGLYLMEIPTVNTVLANGCYESMLEGCSSIEFIYLSDYDENFEQSAFNNWVLNVPSTGEFGYSGSDTTRGPSAIPVGWTVY